jgi:hypothetical protein
MAARIKLGELLVRAGVLDEFKLKAALAEQQRWGGRLGKILVEMNFVSEDLLVKALSKQLGIQRAKLSEFNVPPDILGKIDPIFASNNAVCPERYVQEKKTLVVAMADPTNVGAVDELRFKTGLRIETTLAGELEISQAIDRYFYGHSPIDGIDIERNSQSSSSSMIPGFDNSYDPATQGRASSGAQRGQTPRPAVASQSMAPPTNPSMPPQNMAPPTNPSMPPQPMHGYPQNTGGYPAQTGYQNAGYPNASYPAQNTGGHPAQNAGYPSGMYPAQNAGYPQNANYPQNNFPQNTAMQNAMAAPWMTPSSMPQQPPINPSQLPTSPPYQPPTTGSLPAFRPGPPPLPPQNAANAQNNAATSTALEMAVALDGAQKKQLKALRVMLELLIEKGVFSRDEYMQLVNKR